MDDKTTARPWIAVERSNSTAIQCHSDPVYPITIARVFRHDPNGNERLPDAANGALIVKAANAYDAHQELEYAVQRLLDYAGEDEHGECEAANDEGGPCAWCNLRAALAKARQ